MAQTTIKTKIKHNVDPSSSYVPLKGELVFLSDAGGGTVKFGDGTKTVANLTAIGAASVPWSGITSKPSYYDAKAIKSIIRSGTTFTWTCMDGTTGTFTQQDNNTTYSAGTGLTLSGTTFSLNTSAAEIGAVQQKSSASAQDINTFYDTGIYNNTSGSLSNGPTTYGYGQLLVMAYRKPTGNSKPDHAAQLYMHGGNSSHALMNVITYRTSDASTWSAWQMAAHGAANTAVGSSTSPVYMAANGTITSCGSSLAVNITGNAATASAWASAQTLTLAGDLSGSVSIKGNAAMTLTATVKDDSHNHSNYAAKDCNIQEYTFDLSSYSTNNYYLFYFPTDDWDLNCEIKSPNVGGDNAYNQNHIHFILLAQGWSDTPKILNILYSGCYSANEITIMGILVGGKNGNNAIAVRGGMKYRLRCNKVPILKTSTFTDGNETFICGGTSWSGGDSTSVIWANDGINKAYTTVPFYGAAWN